MIYKCLSTYSGDEGLIKKGQDVEIEDEVRAKEMLKRGYIEAKEVEKPKAKRAPRKPKAKPEE